MDNGDSDIIDVIYIWIDREREGGRQRERRPILSCQLYSN